MLVMSRGRKSRPPVVCRVRERLPTRLMSSDRQTQYMYTFSLTHDKYKLHESYWPSRATCKRASRMRQKQFNRISTFRMTKMLFI